MPRRARFLFWLVSLLIISLGLKLALFTQSYDRPDDEGLQADLAAELENQGFTTNREAMLGREAIRASRGACSVLVVRLGGRGHGRDRFALAAQDVGQVRYAYRGEIYSVFPRVVPLLEEQLWRFAQPVNPEGILSPLLAVAQAEACKFNPAALSAIPVAAA